MLIYIIKTNVGTFRTQRKYHRTDTKYTIRSCFDQMTLNMLIISDFYDESLL